MKITLFKILHAVCICIVMFTQSDLPFRILYCGHLSGSTAFYYGHSLLQILFIADASLIRAPLHYGHLSFLDTSLLRTTLYCKLSLLQTTILYGLYYGLFLLRTPVLCETLSVTDSFMETSLLRTPI